MAIYLINLEWLKFAKKIPVAKTYSRQFIFPHSYNLIRARLAQEHNQSSCAQSWAILIEL